MEFLTPIADIIKAFPLPIAVGIVVVALVAGFIIYSRRTDISEFTSVTRASRQMMEELIEQNRLLAADLGDIRKAQGQTLDELAQVKRELHEVREIARWYVAQCRTCPNRREHPAEFDELLRAFA